MFLCLSTQFTRSGKHLLGFCNVPRLNPVNTEVTDNGELFKDFEMISRDLGKQSGAYGFRMQKNLQRLAKANALANDRTYVIENDIKKVIHLSNWINYDFNNI